MININDVLEYILETDTVISVSSKKVLTSDFTVKLECEIHGYRIIITTANGGVICNQRFSGENHWTGFYNNALESLDIDRGMEVCRVMDSIREWKNDIENPFWELKK